MQPFPPLVWAHLQAVSQGFRENQVTGWLNVKLNFMRGQVGSADFSSGEHFQIVPGLPSGISVTFVATSSSGT